MLASQLDYFSRASDYAVDAGDTHRADCILEQLQVYAANNAFVCDATRVVNETGSDPSGTKYWRTLYAHRAVVHGGVGKILGAYAQGLMGMVLASPDTHPVWRRRC